MPHSAALAAACPHIGNHRRLADLLEERKTIALPGVSVRGLVWVVARLMDGRLRVTPERIVLTHKVARNGSQKPYLQSNGERPEFLHEALNYAERNWLHDLEIDLSLSSGWFELCDPTAASDNQQGGCRPVAAGCATFGMALAPLLASHSEQRSATLNRIILRCSVQPIERNELLGPRASLFRYCSRCGHWLQADHCPGCKVDFPAFLVPHEQGFALPDALYIRWQQQGRTFTSDPTIWK